jgi:hypothetical protein
MKFKFINCLLFKLPKRRILIIHNAKFAQKTLLQANSSELQYLGTSGSNMTKYGPFSERGSYRLLIKFEVLIATIEHDQNITKDVSSLSGLIRCIIHLPEMDRGRRMSHRKILPSDNSEGLKAGKWHNG